MLAEGCKRRGCAARGDESSTGEAGVEKLGEVTCAREPEALVPCFHVVVARAAFWGPATVSPRLITITRESDVTGKSLFSFFFFFSFLFFFCEPVSAEPASLSRASFVGQRSTDRPSLARIVLPFFLFLFDRCHRVGIFYHYQFQDLGWNPPRDKQPGVSVSPLSLYLSLTFSLCLFGMDRRVERGDEKEYGK